MPTPLPAQFGRYRIIRKVGKGGMGAVYLAEDTLLTRQVALKVPLLEGAEVQQRFLREARVAAGIDHPNVCPVYDFGEVNGIHYLTMPYLEGTPLSEQCGVGRPWAPRQAAELVCLIAGALAVLHQRGLMHRDLKPANVMMKPDGTPVLMDFGLARAISGSDRMTSTGAAMGTADYMSPEQVRVDSRAMGPCTDVYSLGVILFELVTGERPFIGPVGVVYGQILYAPAPVPSSLRPGIDPPLDAICQKAMAKKPEDRYPSMAALADVLREYLRRESAAQVERERQPRDENLSDLTRAATEKERRLVKQAIARQSVERHLGKLVAEASGDLCVICPYCGNVLRLTSAAWGKGVKCTAL
jgi:serine/threonine-protein kinase